MHILVTGGAGFIGSHLTADLLAAGHEVTVLDDLSTGLRANVPSDPRCRLITQRVADLSHWKPFQKVDAVVHLAATPSVPHSWRHVCAGHENNLTETLRIIEWCRERECRRLVVASSAAVYGASVARPLREEDTTSPLSPYGLQKLCGERYGALFADHADLTFVALRLFNVYGPRQRPDSAYAGVLARFVSAMAEHHDLTIRGDGLQTRDFVEVSDVARAFRAACEVELPASSLVCNIGTGVASTLLDAVAALRETFPSWRGLLKFEDSAKGDIRDSMADVQRMRKHLGVCALTALPEGLRRLVRWQLATTPIPVP